MEYTPRTSRPALNPDAKTSSEPAVVPTTRTFSSEPALKKKEQATKPKWLRWVVGGAIVVLLGAGIAWFVTRQSPSAGAIDTSKYQAVFLTNGQIYFGKLHFLDDKYLKLTNVFYIQSSTTSSDTADTQKAATNSTDMKLIKLGNEVYGPEDEVIISRDQVISYQNLKTDGNVTKLIEQYKP